MKTYQDPDAIVDDRDVYGPLTPDELRLSKPSDLELCPDPVEGTREGWKWCADCSAIREPIHVHGDSLESMTREDLIRYARMLEDIDTFGLAMTY